MVKDKPKSVAEMREFLASCGYDGDQLTDMKKSQLREAVDTVLQANDTLDSAVVSADAEITPTEQNVPDEAVDEAPPRPTDPEWTKYVLTLFAADELDNGSPKVDGLRRVADKLYGSFNIQTDVIDAPRIDNAGRASVVVRLEFREGDKRGWKVDGAADVFSGNTDRKYASHSLATAETRAEGRALRKALKLTKILSAEETYNAADDESTGTDGRIVHGMTNSLNVMANKIKVDALKAAIKMGCDVQALDELTHKQGLKLSEQLGKYQRNEEVIPDEIRQ